MMSKLLGSTRRDQWDVMSIVFDITDDVDAPLGSVGSMFNRFDDVGMTRC